MNYWEEGYIHGNEERIFINTTLGCRAQCKYCYLPSIGYHIGVRPEVYIDSQEILQTLIKSEIFKEGKDGTIISIGCFSECWDDNNKENTINFIWNILKYGNPIQLATKRYIDYKELEQLKQHIVWKGQLSIFISGATVQFWKEYEKGTVVPKKRYQSLSIQDKLGIPCYLYIKPVLEGVTILDVDYYVELMIKYNVNAVVGALFTTQSSRKTAPIASNMLYYNGNNDEEILKSTLSNYGKVYSYSIEAINEGRKVYSGSN